MSHSLLNFEIKAAKISQTAPVCDFSQEAFTGYNETKVSHNFLCFQKLRSRTADVAEWVIKLPVLIHFFGYRGCHI